jgi:phenylacetate-CoA ligase
MLKLGASALWNEEVSRVTTGVSQPSFDTVAATAQARLLEELFEQLARLHWDGATLAEHRRTHLAETLAFAAERSAWHAERLAGIDLDAVTPDDLTSLPTMSKADLMAAWDRIVTDQRLSLDLAQAHLARLDRDGPSLLLDEYFIFTTGGTTGEPGVFPWSIEEFARFGASNIRIGTDAGDPPPERLTFVGARSLRHPSAWAPLLVYGEQAGADRVVPIDQPVRDVVDALNGLEPDSLWVVSSMLPALVDARVTGALRIAPRRIAVGSDAVDPRAINAAEEAFGVRPIETYPTSDVGYLATQPPGEESMVVNNDLMIVEPVDEHDRPARPGELSHHLLVTSLHHRTAPLLRYRIDDRVRFAPPSDRYPAYPRITEIDGRADDLFRYGDQTVHPHTFRTVITRHDAVRDYQVRQTATGAEVLVDVAGSCDAEALASELTSAMAAAGLPDADVTVTPVDTIPRSRLGKRLLFVAR